MPDLSVLAVFFLVYVRAAAFLNSGPLLVIRGVPAPVKAGLPFFLAAVAFPLVQERELPAGALGYGLLLVSEAGAGLIMGLAVSAIISFLQVAGQLVDFQIGFAMSSVVDPLYGAGSTLLAQYLYLLGLVTFFVVDGHHTLIAALVESYRLVPLGAASFGGGAAPVLVKIFSASFLRALQVSAPVLAVLVVSDLTLGFLARTAPQINVFLTGFPVKIAAGLLVMSFLLPLLGGLLRSLAGIIERDLYTLMKALV